MKIPFHRLVVPSFVGLMLTGCSVTWVKHPESTARDGSRISVTTFDWLHGRDSLVIERYDKAGNRSVYPVEDLPDGFHGLTTETAGNSVILRLFDADQRRIDQRNIPFSSFVAKGR
ncbi:MAG: hypothetical protein EOP88_00085 [Verrucomicrobiaceae bacterium]|nr:MAG: hypothetical protein EOP88_00085 [Verrucomicrobiaceae bacterium]